MSNQLVVGSTEFDNERARERSTKLLREAMKEVTDRIITFGLKSGHFTEVYERALAERFLRKPYLDEVVERLRAAGHLKDPDLVFLFFLEQVFSERIQKTERDADKSLLQEVLNKSFREVQMMRSMSESLNERLKDWLTQKDAIHHFTTMYADLDCEFLLQ